MTAERRERRGEGSVHRRWRHGCESGQGHVARLCPKRREAGWCAQIELTPEGDGKRRRKTIYAPTEKAIRERLRVERRQRDEHGDLATSDPRLEKWLDDWLERVASKRLKPGAMRTYRTSVNLHIKPSIGRIYLSRLGVAHIRRMHADIIDRLDLSPTTAHNAHRVLSAALADAVLEGRVGQNIASVVPAPRKADSERTSVSSDVAKRIMREGDDSRWYVAFLLGVRRGERLGLRWQCVDIDNGIIDLSWSLSEVGWAHGCGEVCGLTKRRCPKRRHPIPKGMKHVTLGDRATVLLTPKSKRSIRVVPIPAPLAPILERQRELTAGREHDLVWCQDNGAPVNPRRDWQDWTNLLDRLGIAHFEPHAMRHTTATLLLEAKVPQPVIAAILGHSSVVTTEGYQHAPLELSRSALDGLAGTLGLPAAATTPA